MEGKNALMEHRNRNQGTQRNAAGSLSEQAQERRHPHAGGYASGASKLPVVPAACHESVKSTSLLSTHMRVFKVISMAGNVMSCLTLAALPQVCSAETSCPSRCPQIAAPAAQVAAPAAPPTHQALSDKNPRAVMAFSETDWPALRRAILADAGSGASMLAELPFNSCQPGLHLPSRPGLVQPKGLLPRAGHCCCAGLLLVASGAPAQGTGKARCARQCTTMLLICGQVWRHGASRSCEVLAAAPRRARWRL